MKEIAYNNEITDLKHQIILAGIRMTVPARTVERNEMLASIRPLSEHEVKQLEDARAELAAIKTELEGCHEAVHELEDEVAKGFDYERPKRFINRFLPALPAEPKKHFRDMVLTDTTPRRETTAVLLTAGLTFLVWLIGTLVPYVLYMGIGIILMGPPAAAAGLAASIMMALVLLAYASLLFVFQGREKLGYIDKKSVESVAHHFLGAEGWTITQRIRACGLYSVNTFWALVIPIIVIPVRFIVGIAILGIYLKVEKTDSKNDQQAVVEAGRFLSVVFKVGTFIGIAFLIFGAIAVLFL